MLRAYFRRSLCLSWAMYTLTFDVRSAIPICARARVCVCVRACVCVVCVCVCDISIPPFLPSSLRPSIHPFIYTAPLSPSLGLVMIVILILAE